jgi:hypothetical protein
MSFKVHVKDIKVEELRCFRPRIGMLAPFGHDFIVLDYIRKRLCKPIRYGRPLRFDIETRVFLEC